MIVKNGFDGMTNSLKATSSALLHFTFLRRVVKSPMIFRPSNCNLPMVSSSSMVEGPFKIVSSTPSSSPMVIRPFKTIAEYKKYEEVTFYYMGFISPVRTIYHQEIFTLDPNNLIAASILELCRHILDCPHWA